MKDTPMTTSDEARAREVLRATPHAATCELGRDLGPRANVCSCDQPIRAMLAFASTAPKLEPAAIDVDWLYRHSPPEPAPVEAGNWVMVPPKVIADLPHLPIGPSLSEEYWFGWSNAMSEARNYIAKHSVYPATPARSEQDEVENRMRPDETAIEYAKRISE